jgi:molecular chaperone HtpG
MSSNLVSLRLKDIPWQKHAEKVVVGKDILELLSSSMYLDPMTIYREYVQNAADSIDDARTRGLLKSREEGVIDIACDATSRTIRILDNGTGIPSRSFIRRLTSFGASAKRGSTARGFRGVGRLAGLGYCQELIFRSRATGEPKVNELRWDCRKIRSALRSNDFTGDLNEIVNEAVEFRQISIQDWPLRFFEVELRGVIRHRDDRLLNHIAIEGYLGQVAPVPFDKEFRFADEITAFLRSKVSLADLQISVNGRSPIRRPHRDRIEISESVVDEFRRVEMFEIPGSDGSACAVGWILHHGYVGALPQRSNMRGFRIRSGDIQVGGENLLEELFPEVRFNTWSVGEIHILDKRIVPNGRRDHFEQNIHFDNLLNHVAPYAREIARQCRLNSTRRRWQREFETAQADAEHFIHVLKQSAVPAKQRSKYMSQIQIRIGHMEKLSDLQDADRPEGGTFREALDALRRRVAKLDQGKSQSDGPLSILPHDKRRAYEEVLGLIYECSLNPAAARALVERIIAKVTETGTPKPTKVN